MMSRLPLAWALRESLREGYNRQQLLADLQAGLIVGVVALPLAMALAIASGVAPQQGLYTIVTAGALVAFLGGSRFQVTGPTAAFVVLLLPIVQKFGLAGLLVAGFLAGLLCLFYGLVGLGDVIQFVPHPVTTGFTSGIALVIATIQLKDFMGLDIAHPSADFFERLADVTSAFPTLQFSELVTGVVTLGIIIYCSKRVRKIPAPIIALSAVTLGTVLLHWLWPEFDVATVTKRFNYLENGVLVPGVPRGLPHFSLPWLTVDPNTPGFELSWAHVKEIFPSAFAISLLGAIESLLSAVVADGMTQKRHNPNAELIALGIGNIVCPLFGGIPATGAIARTGTNVRFGAQTPISAIVHAGFVLLILVSLAPYIGYIPMAALAALLLIVAWNMAERRHFSNILRFGGLDDRLVLLACFGLTVIFDMTTGVAAGLIVSLGLFVRRMALITSVDIVRSQIKLSDEHVLHVPDHVLYYEIKGPLFFGAAHRAMDRLLHSSTTYSHVIIDLRNVHLMDITGSVALDSALRSIRGAGLKVVIIAPDARIRQALKGMHSLQSATPEWRVMDGQGAALKWVQNELKVPLGAPQTSPLQEPTRSS